MHQSSCSASWILHWTAICPSASEVSRRPIQDTCIKTNLSYKPDERIAGHFEIVKTLYGMATRKRDINTLLHETKFESDTLKLGLDFWVGDL
jgi:hypothetical protein